MMIIKQPNGKYLIYDFGKKADLNYTEEDIISIYIERAKAQAKKDMIEAEGLNCVLKDEIQYGFQVIIEKDLKDMGITIPKKELIKKVRLKPKNKQYIECNFEMIAECPNCQAKVVDSIGFTETECNKCGQMLDWGK